MFLLLLCDLINATSFFFSFKHLKISQLAVTHNCRSIPFVPFRSDFALSFIQIQLFSFRTTLNGRLTIPNWFSFSFSSCLLNLPDVLVLAAFAHAHIPHCDRTPSCVCPIHNDPFDIFDTSICNGSFNRLYQKPFYSFILFNALVVVC